MRTSECEVCVPSTAEDLLRDQCGSFTTPGRGPAGNLFAVVKIVMPPTLDEREQALFKELADKSTFNPRRHFDGEATNAK